jgi:hypothetical protein
MAAFDASGNVRWSVPNEYPQIATADGGVIGQSGITYDQNGNATGQINRVTYSWTGNAYQDGPVTQVLAIPLLFALGFSPFEGENDSDNGTSHFPIDSISNDKVRNILTPARWQKFAQSNCGVVFGNSQGIPLMIPNYSLQVVQKKQQMTNFYDLGNPQVGNLTLRQVTGGQLSNNVTLANYLLNVGATGATANMGYDRQTAVVFQASFFSQPYPEFTLAHEVLLHAYAAQPDDAIFGSVFFRQHGLWRPDGSTATINISTWMSTDCTCTPGKPGTTCQANTAQW